MSSTFNWFCTMILVLLVVMWFQFQTSTSSETTTSSTTSKSTTIYVLLKDLLVNWCFGFGFEFGFESIIEFLLLSLLLFILVLPLLLLSTSTFLLVTRNNNNNNNNNINNNHHHHNRYSVDLSEVFRSVYASTKKSCPRLSISSTLSSNHVIITTSRSQLYQIQQQQQQLRHFLEIVEQQHKEDQRLYQRLIYRAFKLWEWVTNRHRSNHFGLSASTGNSGSRMWVHHSHSSMTIHRKRVMERKK